MTALRSKSACISSGQANNSTQLDNHTTQPGHVAAQVRSIATGQGGQGNKGTLRGKETATCVPVARRKGVPMSPLAVKMQHDLQLAGMSERTQESYIRAVRKFAQFIKLSPDSAVENDLRRYLLFIKNDQLWKPNSLKVAYAGLKFFYAHTCPREWATLTKLRVPTQVKLPTVLSIDEVHQLMATIRKPAMKCFFWTVYSLGLRLQEALHLQVSDIDAERMLVHVRRGKGHKDWLVPLTGSKLGSSTAKPSAMADWL